MPEAEKPDLTTLTVQLLSAYLANNTVPSAEVAGLIQSTRTALSGEVQAAEAEQPEFVPAVTVRKSLASRDHIISLIDGKPYKSLKRHLSTRGLSPAEYKQRYNLPKEYPMVAPGYSEQRREVAQRLGLGRKKVDSEASAEAPAGAVIPEEAPAPAEAQVPPVAAGPSTPRKRPARASSTAAKEQVTETPAPPPAETPDVAAAPAAEPVAAKAKPKARAAASASSSKASGRGKKNAEPKVAAKRRGRPAPPAEAEAAQQAE